MTNPASHPYTEIAGNIAVRIAQYCGENQIGSVTVICDTNTYQAAGKQLERHLLGKRLLVETIVLHGHVRADEYSIGYVLAKSNPGTGAYIAVGSGTLTDITRFVSFRTQARFIAAPTAASVDGYTSIGAPLIIEGLKKSRVCHPPEAVFVDSEVIANAPHRLTASGFGDLLGKLTSTADWRMGALLWDEPYDKTIDERSRTAADSLTRSAPAIGDRDRRAVRALMEGLLETGLCMLEFGESRPASGAEHHLSHYWEMQLSASEESAHSAGRPNGGPVAKDSSERSAAHALHGEQVGVATVLTARLYDSIREMNENELVSRIESARFPDTSEQRSVVRKTYDAGVQQHVLSDNRRFIEMSTEQSEALRTKMLDHASSIKEIALSVPSAAELSATLRAAGAPVEPEELGIPSQLVTQGMQAAHFLRDRFTVLKLAYLLKLR